MTHIETILDVTMCILWIATYTLVLIGTVKYRYPLISPMTQAVISPFEFAVLIRLILVGSFGQIYVFTAYAYWTLIEIAIIWVILKSGYIKRKYIVPYIVLVCVMTCVMFYFVTVKGQMFFFSYFNTFIGEVIWFRFILKKDYPMKPIALLAFFTKFIGDSFSIVVYFGDGIWLSNVMCVLLPVLDFAFILVYFKRSRQNEFSLAI